MKPGDLVLFANNGTWVLAVSGKVGLVLPIRQKLHAGWTDDIEFDILVDGVIIKDMVVGPTHSGLEVINENG